MAIFTIAMVSFGAVWSSALVLSPPSTTVDVDEEQAKERFVALPYAFVADSLGVAYGLAGGGYRYYGDNQVKLFGAVLGSSNSSYAFLFSLKDLRAPGTERVFIDALGSVGRYTAQRAYTMGNPKFMLERSGGHGSDKDNFLEGEGWDNWYELSARYMLPIGYGRATPQSQYGLRNGMLVSGASGGNSWNPLENGVTILSLVQFAQRKSLKLEDDGVEESFLSSGLKLELTHDNRDFPENPTFGSAMKLGVSRDFGWPDTFETWTFLEAEYAKYFSLGANDIFRQRVLALNVWTADTPTWREEAGEILNRPPPIHGARLGGFYRMKGFPQNRFHDKSALFYSAEVRLTPFWNPLGNIALLDFLEIDWWQAALFVEAGRVAGEYNLSKLHDDMNWDAGLGLRFMTIRTVVRLDMAVSEEGFNAWAMVGHPF